MRRHLVDCVTVALTPRHENKWTRDHTESAQHADARTKNTHKSRAKGFTHSLIHSFTHSLIHSFTHSLIHSFTHSLIHSRVV